ncbi:hypothetical protein GCM10023200_26170 [Actinomycetospora chlora]|uniref:Uncharacterized protein n=1 Tax=Actinomycetospora chlora TaxID=663608 RepID=A0ABP9B716_9PSEU
MTTTAPAPARPTPPDPQRVRHSGPDGIALPIPFLGTIELSRAELAYVGGIAGLAALGLLEWPIALVIAGGHVLAADRSSKTVRDLGDAMTEA